MSKKVSVMLAVRGLMLEERNRWIIGKCSARQGRWRIRELNPNRHSETPK
jgi:hypothetical protein